MGDCISYVHAYIFTCSKLLPAQYLLNIPEPAKAILIHKGIYICLSRNAQYIWVAFKYIVHRHFYIRSGFHSLKYGFVKACPNLCIYNNFPILLRIQDGICRSLQKGGKCGIRNGFITENCTAFYAFYCFFYGIFLFYYRRVKRIYSKKVCIVKLFLATVFSKILQIQSSFFFHKISPFVSWSLHKKYGLQRNFTKKHT